MTTDNYSQITWQEVRAGDVLMRENGDRLTVERGGEVIVEAVGHELATDAWAHMGFTPYRRKPEMPTVPGAYMDKDGDLCVLGNEGLRSGSAHWMYFGRLVDNYVWLTDRMARDCAPFTRLVPMPSSDAVLEAMQRAEPMCRRERIADAVMALLNGEGEQ